MNGERNLDSKVFTEKIEKKIKFKKFTLHVFNVFTVSIIACTPSQMLSQKNPFPQPTQNNIFQNFLQLFLVEN